MSDRWYRRIFFATAVAILSWAGLLFLLAGLGGFECDGPCGNHRIVEAILSALGIVALIFILAFTVASFAHIYRGRWRGQ